MRFQLNGDLCRTPGKISMLNGVSVADRFEREFCSEWENIVPSLLHILEDLDDVLDQASLARSR